MTRKSHPDNKHIKFEVTQDQWNRFVANVQALDNGMSMSAVMRLFVEEFNAFE